MPCPGDLDETCRTTNCVQFGHPADQSALLPCLHRFHSQHGLNIRFSEDKTVATRVSSFADGLIFSANPLRPNELFMVEIVQNDLGWNGHLRIGITQSDPEKRKEFPRFALPNLVAEGLSWVYTLDRSEVDEELGDALTLPAGKFHKLLRDAPWGSRLNIEFLQPKRRSPGSVAARHTGSRRNSHNGDAHNESQACLIDDPTNTSCCSPTPSLETLDSATSEGSRVGIFYSQVGLDFAFLYFVVNGECRGPFPFELQAGPLFVVCDVYGQTKTVRIVPLYEVPTLQSLCREVITGSVDDLKELLLPRKLIRFVSYEYPAT
ncbi:putative Neuralized-like protein 2 [Hypsibius exemplaris]|uniref:Neuralized-like protein 2 n=1 Tax=Hypsibius exemplaris TaxID=2072580 RepID=A0A1W0WRD4_HYPEX|nr:putative Neuralized-like protein 2 [Hypsibius exemplaris]